MAKESYRYEQAAPANPPQAKFSPPAPSPVSRRPGQGPPQLSCNSVKKGAKVLVLLEPYAG
jgi:hypothetical protein